jgi:hypothetical protein
MLVQKQGNSPGVKKMSKLKFITLAASIMLALAFTLSCSDDKDDPPPTTGWLTCSEANKIVNNCKSKGGDVTKCIIDSGACNGLTDINKCQEHYDSECKSPGGGSSSSSPSGGSSSSQSNGSASLDGTWQLGPVTLEINGTEFIYDDSVNRRYKGTITYNSSSGSISYVYKDNNGSWDEMPSQAQTPLPFNYTLSADGNTLTFSGGTGNGALSGDWIKQ